MLAILALALGSALCATLQGNIADLEPVDIRSTSLVVRDLDSAHRSRYGVDQDGRFEIYDLVPGQKYLITLDSDTLDLPYSYLVTPHDDAEESKFDIRKVSEGRPLTALSSSVAHPLTISGLKRTDLVVDRADFSVFKFFTQPTVLLSLGALVLVTYLPSLLADMDPELLEELQKNQIKPGAASEKLQNFDLAKSIADRRTNANTK